MENMWRENEEFGARKTGDPTVLNWKHERKEQQLREKQLPQVKQVVVSGRLALAGRPGRRNKRGSDRREERAEAGQEQHHPGHPVDAVLRVFPENDTSQEPENRSQEEVEYSYDDQPVHPLHPRDARRWRGSGQNLTRGSGSYARSPPSHHRGHARIGHRPSM